MSVFADDHGEFDGLDGFGTCQECDEEGELDDGVCEACWDGVGVEMEDDFDDIDQDDDFDDDLDEDEDGWAALEDEEGDEMDEDEFVEE